MTFALTAIAVVVLTQDAGSAASISETAGPTVAVEAMAGVDVLAANVVNDSTGAGNPFPDAGTPKELTAAELGISASLHATALDSRLHVDLDYMGRQPIAGNSQDTAIHLLYQAEVSGQFLDQKLTVGLGRFLAPSAVLLPVDGLRVALKLGQFQVQVFGGRRAISSSDTSNVSFSTFLPAAGGSASYGSSLLTAEAGATYSRDQLPLLMETVSSTVDASSAFARATSKPLDWLVVGGELALAQRANYLLGPGWNSVDVSAQTVDLFYALLFVELRPLKNVRVDYDLHFQQAELFRQGLQLSASDPTLTALGFVPQFIDNRGRVRVRPLELGWLGVEVRHRVRRDWNELRAGVNADLAPLWALGVCLRAGFTYDAMFRKQPGELPADRSFWYASLGWRGRGFDVALGASDVERANQPISSRVYVPPGYEGAALPVDLSPFVLGAQRIAYARVFYGTGIFFAGIDFEQNLVDGRERRVFAQLGARLDKEW
jgi:hypothetical protein